MASLTRFSLIVAPAVVHLACRDGYVITDNWGPPAGYAAVQGTVRDTSGTPAPNTRVSITRCSDTITPRFAPSRDSVVPSVRDLLLP